MATASSLARSQCVAGRGVWADARFDKIRHDPRRFAVAWFLQGLWVFLVSWPVLAINTSKKSIALNAFGWLSVAMIAVGLAVEAIADVQKSAFRMDPHNEGKFFHGGLWAMCRHPNCTFVVHFLKRIAWSGNGAGRVDAGVGVCAWVCVVIP
jgi:steroid 5-alpha reductase family enzyme